MASWAMGLNLGVFRFLSTTRKSKRKQMRSWSLCAARLLACDYFTLSPQYMQLTYAPDKPQLFSIMGKTRRPPNWAPCQDQDGAGSGISFIYLCSNLRVPSKVRFFLARLVRSQTMNLSIGCIDQLCSSPTRRWVCKNYISNEGANCSS